MRAPQDTGRSEHVPEPLPLGRLKRNGGVSHSTSLDRAMKHPTAQKCLLCYVLCGQKSKIQHGPSADIPYSSE